MRLARGREVRFDAHVELLRADPEPDPATAFERRRFLELLEPEELAEEAARVTLAARRGSELDVVDAADHRLRLARACYASGYSRW